MKKNKKKKYRAHAHSHYFSLFLWPATKRKNFQTKSHSFSHGNFSRSKSSNKSSWQSCKKMAGEGSGRKKNDDCELRKSMKEKERKTEIWRDANGEGELSKVYLLTLLQDNQSPVLGLFAQKNRANKFWVFFLIGLLLALANSQKFQSI